MAGKMKMVAFHLGIIFLAISFVHCAPIEEEEEERGHPICLSSRYDYDEKGYLCNADRTGYHYCEYDNKLAKSVSCPSGTRCNCGGDRCYVVNVAHVSYEHQRIRPMEEKNVCEMIPPTARPLPDPALFTYRGVSESEWESYEGPDYTVKHTWSGEVRQDIKNGKYMKINRENSHFNMVLGKTKYTGNLKEKTCQSSSTSTPGPYWSVRKFLGGYKYKRTDVLTNVQTWIKAGSSRYDASKYFWVSVKDGFTLLGRYSVSEGRDWEDEGLMLSSDRDVYYNTTYGVDSTRWFDVPRFCLKKDDGEGRIVG